jgi:hypothetical protein
MHHLMGMQLSCLCEYKCDVVMLQIASCEGADSTVWENCRALGGYTISRQYIDLMMSPQ